MARDSSSEKASSKTYSIPLVMVWAVFGLAGLYVLSGVNLAQFGLPVSDSSNRYEPGFPNIKNLTSDTIDIWDLHEPVLLDNVNVTVKIPKGTWSGHYISRSDYLGIDILNDTKKFYGSYSSHGSGGQGGGGGFGITMEEDTTVYLVVEGTVVLTLGNRTIINELDRFGEFSGVVDAPILNLYTFRGMEDEFDTQNEVAWAYLTIDKGGAPYDIIVYDGYFNTLLIREGLEGQTNIDFRDFGTQFNTIVIKTSDSGYDFSVSYETEIVATKKEHYQQAGLGATLLFAPLAITLFLWQRDDTDEEV